ncbi:hypothetical protein [Chryseobacterium sp. CFBP8996]|uniref:hypothetical protein n=1 Tax=Chryseobacterium sp. CFBP8996 TaxID=3096529 RepID=UPI002A6A791C|nr:hypothetical protein [Chryseobacterium sp. CFBP8996]MDY0933025.1 hypothetical protein [Chryseobacterium sp. CFBP8996]
MIKKNIFFCVFVFGIFSAQKNTFPIIAFQGIPSSHSNDRNYQVLKNAGFTVNLNMFDSLEEVEKALNIGHKNNVKIIALIPNIKNTPGIIAEKIKNNPALLAYYIEDEPPTSRFLELSEIVKNIKSIDDKKLIYINLMPTYAGNVAYAAVSYDAYVKQFLNLVKPNVLSFDHYPIVNNTVREDFYENLEIIRSNAYEYNIPFWAFACTAIHFAYREPTLQSLKLQQFSNLLYGAQGLQYYTYWTVNDQYWKDNHYSYAIVDDIGNPTPTYNFVKTINQQIQRLAWVFYGAKADAVYHTGNEIPEATKELVSIPKGFKHFSTNGNNALISFMTNKENKFIIIQNKSMIDNLTLNYQLAKKMKIIDNSTGKVKNTEISKKNKAVILPGDILIFTY